jgi:hypothetical protein
VAAGSAAAVVAGAALLDADEELIDADEDDAEELSLEHADKPKAAIAARLAAATAVF